MKISLDQGIEQILYEQRQAADTTLPDNINALRPSEQQVNNELARVFDTRTLESCLTALARPDLANPDVLRPDVFGRHFAQLPDVFGKAAENLDGACKDAVASAADMINGEKGLIDMLNFYRNLLVQS